MTLHDTSITASDHPAASPPPPTSARRLIRMSAVTSARILSGLFAGFFLTYSMSVVVGLARVDDVTYVTTFQSINATIRNPTFAVVFFGTVPVVLLAAALDRAQRRLLGVGAALLFATMAVTFAFNVPLNDQLATYADVTPTTAATARADFEDTWNRWNLLRTITSIAGAMCICATVSRRRSPAT